MTDQSQSTTNVNKTEQSLEIGNNATNSSNIEKKFIMKDGSSLVKKFIIIIACTLVIAAIAIVIIFAVKKNSNDNKNRGKNPLILNDDPEPSSSIPLNSTFSSIPSSSVSSTFTSIPSSSLSSTFTSIPLSSLSSTFTSIPSSSLSSTFTSIPLSSLSSTFTSIPSSSLSSTFTSIPLSSLSSTFLSIPLSSTTPQYLKPSVADYKEAEKLLNSEMIEENHNLLNESSKLITESLEICNNTSQSIKPISSNVSYSIPDFLDNVTDNSLKTVKSDINLYNSKYEELTEKANNLTGMVSESIQNLSTPLNNIKEDVNKMVEQFEDKIKSFSLPLILEKNGLINSTGENKDNKRRLLLEDKIQKYKNEIGKLNNIYNNFFKYIKQVVDIITENIVEIPNSVKDLNINLEKSILEYGELLNKFKKEESTKEMHENLLLIKQSFLNVKENMNEKKKKIEERINFLEELQKNNTYDYENFQNETDIITENINNISDSIINEINDERKKNGENLIEIPKPTASSLIADSIIKSIYRSFQIIINIEIIKKK